MGIRTPERLTTVTRFPVARLRPTQPSLRTEVEGEYTTKKGFCQYLFFIFSNKFSRFKKEVPPLILSIYVDSKRRSWYNDAKGGEPTCFTYWILFSFFTTSFFICFSVKVFTIFCVFQKWAKHISKKAEEDFGIIGYIALYTNNTHWASCIIWTLFI